MPFKERVLFDYFSIGCCIVELILKKEADKFYQSLINFEQAQGGNVLNPVENMTTGTRTLLLPTLHAKTPGGLSDIFSMKAMGNQSKIL